MNKPLAVSLLLLCGLSACSLLKASPSRVQVFVPNPELLMEKRQRAPFHSYWVFDGDQYFDIRKKVGKVKVLKVDTSNVEKIYLSSQGSPEVKEERIDEAKNLARYLEGKINLLLENQEISSLVSKADKDEAEPLKLRLSLTSVIPTNPGVNFAGSVAGFFVPGGGLIKYFGEGSVAMEGFVESPVELKSNGRVGNEPKALEQYADREGQKTSAFSLKDYQRYAHIRQVLDEWAMQIVELLNTSASHTVEDSLPVTLNPF